MKTARKKAPPSAESMRNVKTAYEMTPLYLRTSIVQGQHALRLQPPTELSHVADAGYHIAMALTMLAEPLIAMVEAWAKTYGAQDVEPEDDEG